MQSLPSSVAASVNDSIHKRKLEIIQVSRGLAAILVVIFHATELSNQKFQKQFLLNIFNFGYAGVDFFFVLSGFIIFLIHRYDIGNKNKLKPFILKRFIRLYPMYWVITLTLLPMYFLIPSLGKGYERNLEVIIKSLLLYPQEHLPILIVGWSLSNEVFFYLIFSLAIVLPNKVAKKIVYSWLGVTFILFILSITNYIDLNRYFLLAFIFSSHNIEFAFGCLAAYLISKHKFEKQESFLLATGTVLFALYGICDSYKIIQLNSIIAYGIPSTLIVIGAASLDINKSVKMLPIFGRLGDASYSIYLIHYPLISLFVKLTKSINLDKILNSSLLMTAMILLTLYIGLISYSYIEKPLVGFLRTKLLTDKYSIN